MANLRPMLFMGLLVLSYLMWIEWQKDYGPQPVPASATAVDNTKFDTLDVPPPANNALPSGGDLPSQDAGIPTASQSNAQDVINGQASQQAEMTSGLELLTVTTDVLKVEIDLVGGTLVSAQLLDYPQELKIPAIKVDLLSRGGPDMFIAQSGLLSRNDAPNHTSTYRADQLQYTLENNAEEIRVPLTWQNDEGIRVTKTFIFKRGEYEVGVRHTLSNDSGQAWTGSRYEQLQRAVPTDQDDGGFTNPGRYSFFGIGFYSPDEKLEKIDFDDVESEPYQ